MTALSNQTELLMVNQVVFPIKRQRINLKRSNNFFSLNLTPKDIRGETFPYSRINRQLKVKGHPLMIT